MGWRIFILSFDQLIQQINENNKELYKEMPLLEQEIANSLIENQISQFPLPQGVALNFLIDGEEKIIPMVVEVITDLTGTGGALNGTVAGVLLDLAPVVFVAGILSFLFLRTGTRN